MPGWQIISPTEPEPRRLGLIGPIGRIDPMDPVSLFAREACARLLGIDGRQVVERAGAGEIITPYRNDMVLYKLSGP